MQQLNTLSHCLEKHLAIWTKQCMRWYLVRARPRCYVPPVAGQACCVTVVNTTQGNRLRWSHKACQGEWCLALATRTKTCCCDSNQNMGSVDSFDQLAPSYCLVQLFKKSQGPIFYDSTEVVETAVMSLYILMHQYTGQSAGTNWAMWFCSRRLPGTTPYSTCHHCHLWPTTSLSSRPLPRAWPRWWSWFQVIASWSQHVTKGEAKYRPFPKIVNTLIRYVTVPCLPSLYRLQ